MEKVLTPPTPAHTLTSRRMRPTLLAVALLAAGMHAPDALALGLGSIKTRSVIGEPFRAEIALVGSPESRLGSECFSLDVPPSTRQDELPWLTRARIRMQGQSIFITGASATNEPILMVGLRIGCGFELAREYTVLMQPGGLTAQSAPAAAAAPSGTAAAPRASDPAPSPRGRNAEQGAPEPAKPVARAPRKPRRNTVATPRDRLYVAPGIDSGNGLKMSGGLAPRAEASEAQRDALRTEQRLLAALDEQIATHLAIEDKVKQLEARLADLQKQLSRTERSLDAVGAPPAGTPVAPDVPASPPVDEPAAIETPTDGPATGTPSQDDSGAARAETPSAPAQAPGELTNEPVRVINKLPVEVQSTALPGGPDINWLVAAFGALAAGSILGGTWLWRRRKQKVSAVTSVRRRHAEDAVASLMAERLAAASRTEEPESGPDVGDEAARTSDVTESAEPASESAIASVTSIDYFPGEAPDEHMEGMEIAASARTIDTTQTIDFEFDGDASDTTAMGTTKLDLEFDTFVGASSIGAPEPLAPANGPRLVSASSSATGGAAFNHVGAPANEESAPSHQHVLELAEIMMSFGRSEGAAQALSEFLRDYPKESLIPWLKLLELYHSNGHRGEYDDLAPKLNRAFNVKVPEWETFNEPSTTQESVEQFAHIMARINTSWPNQDCFEYITELLRDNRAGTRIGFPLGVIDDLLLLRSMLEWLLANPVATEAPPPRLALL